jgi:hypothetical protein
MTTRTSRRGVASTPAQAAIPFHVRQGDVLLIRADVDLHGARHVPRDGDRLVLAYGEVTGHAHAIREKRAELRVIDGHRYLDAPAPVVVEHEEHAPIRLDPGVYEVIIQREYVPSPLPEQAWRPVID